MKNKLLFSILIALLFVSCYNYKNYRLDGMWQLKTIQDANGNKNTVDTVYYSFQRETVFSFTVLENPSYTNYPFYGYVDMPSGNKVHVLIDNNSAGNDNFKRFLSISGWSSADIVFDIKKYNHTNLILFDSGNSKTYTLKKF